MPIDYAAIIEQSIIWAQDTMAGYDALAREECATGLLSSRRNTR